MKREHYPLWDWLRLFAALEVVAIHTLNSHAHHGFDPYVQPVPLFVCLSAFLIPASFERSDGWRTFAWKRVLRVVPAFVLSFALVAILIGPQALGPTLLCYASLGLLGVATANGPLWSLSVEEVLYALHGLKRRFNLWRWPVVFALFVVCCAVPVLFPNPLTDRIMQAGAAFFLGNLAFMYRKQLERLSWFTILAAGALFWYLPHYRNIGLAAWQFTSSLTCLSVVLLAWRLPQPKWRMPDLSYGIYIYHRPILTVFAAICGSKIAAVPYTLAATFVLAALSWYLVEKPILKRKDRPWQFPRKSPEPRIVEATA